jgi:hypothetical protein
LRSDFPRNLAVLGALSRATAARKAYEKFSENPAHPSLRLERLRSDRRAWSVRITRNYRAVALRSSEEWVWLWIGDHQEFDRRFPA